MKVWPALLLALVVFVTASVTRAEQQPPSPEPEVRATLDRFFAAYSRQDMAAALAQVTQTPEERDWVRDYLQGEFNTGTGYVFTIGDLAVRNPDEPYAVARALISWEWLPKGKTQKETGKQHWDFALIREAGAWKLRAFRFAEANLLSRFKAAADAAERKELLQREAGIVNGWLPLSLREQAEGLSTAEKPEEAERLATIAFEVAEWMNDDYERAYCHLMRGVVRRQAKKWNPALEDWDAAETLFEKAGNKEGLAKTWRNAAALYHHVAEFEKSIDAYEKSIRYWKAIQDEKSEADMLQDLGTVFQDVGKPEEAEKRYQQALTIQVRRGAEKSQAQLLGNLAAIRQEQERYAEALELYERAGQIYARIQDRSGEATFRTNLGNLYDLMGQPEEAVRHHQLAIKAAEKSPDRRDLMIALHNLGNFYTRAGKTIEALDNEMASMKLASELGDARFEAQSLNIIGELFFREEEWQKAIGMYQDALEVGRDTGNRIQQCVATVGLAGTYSRLKHVGRALYYFGEARKLTGSAGDLMLQMNAARLEGEFHAANGDLPRAVQCYRRAISMVERTREQNAVRSLQTSYLREYSFLYQRLADYLARLGDSRGAFAVSEQVRARGLVDVIRSGMFRITKTMSEAERKQEAALEERLSHVSRALEKVVRTDDVERLQREQAEARTELQKFQDILYVRHPQLRAQRAGFEPATPEELTHRILDRAPRTAILSYFVLAERTLLFVLRRAPSGEPRLSLHSVPIKGNTLLRRAEEFWQACSTPGGDYQPGARALYRDLIQPALPELAGIEHLVLIPGSDLGILPFSALLDARDQPLVASYALSYAPSATALMHQADLAPDRALPVSQFPLLAFGNPVFPANLSELPATEGEVTEISRLFGPQARAFTRKDALESRAKELVGRARIIHFATHGTLDERAPMYSSIVLTRDDREDGFLQARELSELDLHADLVVLSACETALGQKIRGEGIVGLAWALFVGGARSTVASQWQVPDESTRTLMVQFYRRLLRSGSDRAEAMRQAQLALLRDRRFAHPYHWAPFTLSGQWSSAASPALARVVRH